MKKLYTLFVFLFCFSFSKAQNPDAFITTWGVTAADLGIVIPIMQDSGNNFTVDLGDGTVLNNQTGNINHTFASAGIYTVTITGNFKRINFYTYTSSKLKIKTIEQWGSNQWETMQGAFYGCKNLIINAIDAPDLSQATSLYKMFAGASALNQSINHWDVSTITTMQSIFSEAISFNQPLDNWDVSNVTDMANMFKKATAFNQPLTSWDVSAVTNMAMMFYQADSFNQDLSNWNFNDSVLFHYQNETSHPTVGGFLSDSGFDITHYDNLLNRFAELGLQNKSFRSAGMEYCNSGMRNYLINNLGWIILADNLSENCGNHSISGTIRLDENGNGCETNALDAGLLPIKLDNGLFNTITFTNNLGEYLFNLNEGNYDIELFNLPTYFSANPASTHVTIAGSETNEIVNFCITGNQTIEDLEITQLPTSLARPGFACHYVVIVKNKGTHTVSNAVVSLTFDHTMQSVVSSSPLSNSNTENQLIYELGNLEPFQSKKINLTMLTFPPPLVNGGDDLGFNAIINPVQNDFTPNDNAFGLKQVVVNSYDPNDKQVLQGETIPIEQAEAYLHYLIRFQNTGTASAINVRIEDVLHESLNWNTLQIVGSSHDFRAEITENNQLAFIFNQINLPHEAEDEEGSNGFVAYKIKPIEGLTVGDFITGNEASIFFDFNLPIITNSVATEIVNSLNINEFNLNKFVSIYPNPANDVLNIKVKDDLVVEEVQLINLQGRLLVSVKQNLENINLSGLSSGVYLIKLKTNLGTISSKIIKN